MRLAFGTRGKFGFAWRRGEKLTFIAFSLKLCFENCSLPLVKLSQKLCSNWPKSIKWRKNVDLEFWHFPSIFVLLKIDLFGNIILPQPSAFQNLAQMDYFWHFWWMRLFLWFSNTVPLNKLEVRIYFFFDWKVVMIILWSEAESSTLMTFDTRYFDNTFWLA